jgi:hypothetical protein
VSERYVPEQAAVDWARAAVERTLARMEAHHAWLRANEAPQVAEGFRRSFWWLRRELIGGQGCVIAAFDQRRPEVEKAMEHGRPWVDRTMHDRAGGPPLAPPVRAARSAPLATSPGAERASTSGGGGRPAGGAATPPGQRDWPPPPELRHCPNCNQALSPHGCSACNWPDPWEDQG